VIRGRQAHVSAAFVPFVGLFGEHRPDEADNGGPVGLVG
jgi:hypothetical protein